MQRMNIINNFIKIILYLAILLLMAAPVTAIIIMYYNKLWLFKEMPPYFTAGLIVIIFFLFSINLFTLKDKLYNKKPFSFAGLPDNLPDITSVQDAATKIADILFESMSLKNVFVMLHDKDSNELQKFYSKGEAVEPLNIGRNSQLINWFSHNREILLIDRFINNRKIPAGTREETDKMFSGMNIDLILPLSNENKIVGIICGGKEHGIKFKQNEIEWLKAFSYKCEHYIKNSMDYEEWNQGQLASGMLDLSSEILSKAVPVNLPKLSEIAFGAFYIPRYREGIDYFDIITPTNTGAGVIATDISGRGMNNAIYSVLLRSAFHSCIEEAHSTFSVMQKLNNSLQMYTKGEGGIVKAYYFYYNFNTRRLTYSNAGFQAMEIYRVDKNYYESLDTDGFPLGTDITANYGMGRTNLLIGDIGFLYSRSLIDSKNQKGEKFGLTQLREIIKENRRRYPDEITGILKNEFLSFMGSSSPDSNVLVIIFKV